MRSVHLAGLLLCATAAVLPAQAPPANHEAARALVASAMETDRLPSLSVAVGRAGRILFREARGLADLENAVTATPASVYRIGSISKTLTATLALKLAEEKRFDLDAPIQDSCAAFRPRPERVTARLLLAHLGGIRGYDPKRFREEFLSSRRYANASEAVAIFKNDALAAPPGTKYVYSGWGYVLLACALDGASGTPYRAELKRLVLDKAEMTATRVDVPEDVVPRRVRGYSRSRAGVLENSPPVDLSDKEAAGGLLSTPEDLVRFGMSLVGGRLLSAASLASAWTPQTTSGGAALPVGLGWQLASTEEAFHGGSSVGASAYLYVHRPTGTVVAFTTNVDLWTAPRHKLAQALAAAFAP